jgi:sugar lactone lactonase YvrE
MPSVPRRDLSLPCWLAALVLLLVPCGPLFGAEKTPWLLGKAYKLPSEYTNQESGYFSLVAGLDGKLYVGAAKYGVNAYLLEHDPKTEKTRMVLDVHEVIKLAGRGYAAQAKIHTRNNVGASGRIYVGSKQGYPEKGEHRCDYPGGYVLVHDPKTGKNEHYGIARARHGIISVMPDESRGVAYVSTCSDDRPIDHTHFMVLDLKTRTYHDLGDMEHSYAFIVLDDRGRAYHPVRGGTVARYDPETKKLEKLSVTVDGQPAGKPFTGDQCILNWDASPDGKTLWAVEMSTNALYRFDLTTAGKTLAGTRIGDLLPEAKGKPRRTDCRAMCAGPDGSVWAAVTEHGLADGPLLHLVSYRPGTKAPRDHGVLGVANPDFTTFTDSKGKPKPWHHTMPKKKDGTRSPWQPMGVCALPDGSVYVMTIAPFTLLRFGREQVK